MFFIIVGILCSTGLLESPQRPPSKIPTLSVSTGLAPQIIIVGLPRTGTTTLHRLLAAAPGARALASWEALNPAPFRGEQGHQTRLKEAERAASAVRYLAPDFFAVHPIDPTAPEEEVVLLDQTLMSTVSVALMHVPTWASWLADQEPTVVSAQI